MGQRDAHNSDCESRTSPDLMGAGGGWRSVAWANSHFSGRVTHLSDVAPLCYCDGLPVPRGCVNPVRG